MQPASKSGAAHANYANPIGRLLKMQSFLLFRTFGSMGPPGLLFNEPLNFKYYTTFVLRATYMIGFQHVPLFAKSMGKATTVGDTVFPLIRMRQTMA